jgi:5-oxoprolinase (ATP-hydrolysing)
VIGEALDFGVELFDAQGGSLAHAPRSMPVFHFCLPHTVAHLLRAFPPASLRPGDVLVTNDPWLCAGHLPDIAVVTPVFHHSRLVAFVASVGNAADIGGTKDNAAAREVYEEGILIPPTRLTPQVLDILAANVRTPDMVRGDVEAQVAANALGAERLVSFLDEYGLSDLAELAAAIQARAAEAMRSAVAAVPDGLYRAETWTDGLDEPLRLPVAITVAGDRMHVDYSGAPPQAPRGGINCPAAYTESHTLYALKLLLTPEVPSNAGCFQPFTIEVPVGSILGAVRPASVALRTRTGWHLHELIYQALAPALPDRVQAGSGLAFLLSATGAGVADHLFLGGGQGASAGADGHSTLLFPTSAANVSVEMFEQRVPLVVEEKAFVCDSGGAGQFRGGLGQRVTVRGLASGIALGAFPEGLRAAPPGLAGGLPGRKARLLHDGRPLARTALVRLGAGERLTVEMPGGGGWGDPHRRDRGLLAADLAEGLVSPEQAATVYGASAGANPKPTREGSSCRPGPTAPVAP